MVIWQAILFKCFFSALYDSNPKLMKFWQASNFVVVLKAKGQLVHQHMEIVLKSNGDALCADFLPDDFGQLVALYVQSNRNRNGEDSRKLAYPSSARPNSTMNIKRTNTLHLLPKDKLQYGGWNKKYCYCCCEYCFIVSSRPTLDSRLSTPFLA